MSMLRTARRVAVASAVHGRVQQRQAQKFAGPPPAAAAPAPVAPVAAVPVQPDPVPPPAAPVPATPPADPAQRLALIVQLGELRDAGLLTPEEFEAQKARLLA
ncbi:MAG TPA: SHOCT domain-containing protein [Cellulomonas sp.]